MRRNIYFSVAWLVLSFFLIGALTAQTNMLPNGDFEEYAPSFWEKYNDGLGGAQATWADDEAAPNPWAPAGVDVPSYRSFKVVKSSAATDAVGWKSVNNADLYWNNAAGNVLYTLSFYAKTSGVNTSPSGQDGMIGVWYRFYSGGSLIGEQFVALDQTAGSTDWTKYTGALLVSSEPDEVYAYAVMEMNATGTVWFDNIDCGTDPWSMGIFSGDAETPVGWMYWTDSSMPNFASLVTDTVHGGNYGILLYEKDNESDEMVYYSEPVAAQPETWYKLGVWVKTDSVNTDAGWLASSATPEYVDSRLGVCFFYHIGDILHSWDLTGGDQFFYVDQRDAATGWTHYIVVSKSPTDATGISIRARFNNFPTGYAWYDDFTIEELDVMPNILTNGDFEEYAPSFWEKYNDGLGGAQATWADDEAAPNPWAPAGVDVPSYRSFKVVKSSAATDAVGWKSVNNADLYWNNAAGNVLYTLSFYAKTSGVNTSPSGQDGMIGVWYRFYSGGSLIGEQFVALDQTAGSTDWTKYTGALLVSSEPDEVYAYAVMEMNATGTVWFDNIDCGTDPWSMGIFSGDAETPVGWMYWTDSSMPNFASLVTDTVHGGNYGILLYEKDNESDEMVYYSEPVAAQPETWYKLGVWVKTDSVNTDAGWLASSATPEYVDSRLGVCFFYHIGDILHSWDLTGGDQFFYVDQRDAATGWTHYIVVSKSPTDATGISIRARFNNFPTGYAWYDDFTIEPTDVVVSIEDPASPISILTNDFNLLQNYPNPFNPETIIEYLVPERGKVELNVYNMLGQKVRSLVSDVLPAGTYQVLWNGKDDSGRQVATGVYLYQLRGKNALITRKMILMK